MQEKKDKRRLKLIEKIAILLIVILIVVILLLFFNEQISGYLQDFIQWYESG